MTADTKTHLYEWSTTESGNLPVGSTVISTNLDDNLRMIQKVVRDLASPTTLAASAGTTDLGSKDETFITTTGTAVTITGLGTVSAGIYKWVIFNAAHVLTHNGTSLILPTAANITAASGDVACFVSLGSGNWKCLTYMQASGLPLVSSTLSGLIAATAANTIANGDYAQAWQWKLTTNSKQAFSLTESAASTGTDPILFDVGTIAASTAWPIRVRVRTQNVLTVDEVGQTCLAAAAGEDLRIGYTSAGAAPSTTGAPGSVAIIGQKSGDTTTSGNVVISGGVNSDGGNGGPVTISGGSGTVAGTVAINGSTVTVASDGGLILSGTPFKVAGTAPSVTSGGGTGVAITGTDTAFQVTFGTGDPTSVTVTFATAYATAPFVIVSGTQSGQVVHVGTVNTTTVQIASSTAFSSGTKINVLCIEEV